MFKKQKNNLKILLLTFLSGFFVLTSLSLATFPGETVHAAPLIQCGNTDTGRLIDPQTNQPIQSDRCTFKDLISTAVRLIQYLFGAAGVIAVGGIVFGGFQMVMSSGNESLVESGKKTVINSLIGLAIVLLSVLAVQTLNNFLGLKGGDPVTDPAGFIQGGGTPAPNPVVPPANNTTKP